MNEENAHRPRRWPSAAKSALTHIALGLCSLGIAMGTGELFCRLLNLGTNILYERGLYQPSEDPVLAYELTPGYQGRSYGTTVTVNSQGFRNGEITPIPAVGTYRIVCIGDSMTFGMGVGDDEAWPQVLAREMRPPPGYTRVEVVNAGVCGYNLVQYCAFIRRKALALRPDRILIGLVENDLDPPFHVENGYLCVPRKKTSLPIPGKRWFQTHSALYQFLSFKYSSFIDSRNQSAVQAAKQAEPAGPSFPDTVAKAEEALSQTLDLVATTPVHIEGVVLFLSGDSSIPDLCRRAGLRCFSAKFDPQNRLLDGHPNPEGHRQYADQIAQHLAEK